MGHKGLPIFEFKIDRKKKEDGVKLISIVDRPATMSNFYMFDSQEVKKYSFVDEPKGMIAGLALIPSQYIYRETPDGQAFYGFFSVETIEELRNKFMKEKHIDQVNFQHIEQAQAEDIYLVESYIVATQYQQKDLKERFNIEAPFGSWFVQYKCDNLETFKQIQDLGFKGFSVEAYLEQELVTLNNQNNKKTIMNKIVEKFKTVLAEIEAELAETPMEKIAETGQSIKIGKEGEPVMIVEANPGDPMGEPVETPCPDGQYKLESGDTIECKNGALVSRQKLAEPMPEETPKETPVASGDTKTEIENAEYPWDKCIQDQLDAGYDEETAAKICGKIKSENMTAVDAITALGCKKKEELAEVPVDVPVEVPVVPDQTSEVSAKTLGDLIDVSKDGEYYIEVVVSGGKITEASVEAQQALIKEQFATACNTIDAQKKEIELLKSQLKLPVTKPIINPQAPKKFSKEELDKMTPYERNAIARGFRIIK